MEFLVKPKEEQVEPMGCLGYLPHCKCFMLEL